MTTRLIIARHGNTFTPEDTPTRVGKHTDLPLVASGLEQGARLGEYLHAHKLKPSRAYSSTLQRTKGMITQINQATGWDLHSTPLTMFDEIDYGVDENKTEAEVIARIGQDAIILWDTQAVPPAGWHVDVESIISSWKDFARDILSTKHDQTVLVVTSNGIARFAPHILDDVDGFYAKHCMKMKTGALSLFTHDGGCWTCDKWNIRP